MSPINQNSLETLLHMTEGDALDFKSEQYALPGAGKDMKSELVKDIIAMANAWKNTDAFILIGVEEVPGQRAVVRGVSHHLDDADLQQLMKDKTNQPVRFNYIASRIDGKDVGVIRIPQDHGRPVYLTKDYGRLKKEIVYVRRGSSTVEASPSEIAQMGVAGAVVRSIPIIELEFADPHKRTRYGTDFNATSFLLIDPPPQQIDMNVLRELFKRMPSDFDQESMPSIGLFHPPRNFLTQDDIFSQPSPKEVREYHQELALLTPIGFYLKNKSGVTAIDVRVEIYGKVIEGLILNDEYNYPENRRGIWGIPKPIITSVNHCEHGEDWTVSIDVKKLQPQEECWITDYLYVGSRSPLQVEMLAKIFADNIPVPQEVPLSISIVTSEKVYRKEEWDIQEEE